MSDSNSGRAFAAATAAGRDLGLDVSEAKIVHDVFSVVVRLDPSPVVVRVPTVLPVGLEPDVQVERQCDELAVVGWLHENGHPVVPFWHPEPIRRDGFSMTFWQRVPTPDTEPDYAASTRLVPALHEALAGYPRALPFMSPLDESIPKSFDHVGDFLTADEIKRLRAEWEVLQPLRTREGWEKAFPDVPLQVIHGDAPGFNLIGSLYSDFECVTVGPREWDLTLCGPDLVAVYDDVAKEPLHAEALRVCEAMRMVQVMSVFALVPQLPALAENLQLPLGIWRSMAQLTAI